MQKRRLRHVSRLFLLRLLLTCALGAIALAALLAAHVFPSSKIQLPKQLQYDIGHQRWSGEQSWMWEFAPPSLSKISLQSRKLDGANGTKEEFKKLWKPPSNRGFVPCVEPSELYSRRGVGIA